MAVRPLTDLARKLYVAPDSRAAPAPQSDWQDLAESYARELDEARAALSTEREGRARDLRLKEDALHALRKENDELLRKVRAAQDRATSLEDRIKDSSLDHRACRETEKSLRGEVARLRERMEIADRATPVVKPAPAPRSTDDARSTAQLWTALYDAGEISAEEALSRLRRVR